MNNEQYPMGKSISIPLPIPSFDCDKRTLYKAMEIKIEVQSKDGIEFEKLAEV